MIKDMFIIINVLQCIWLFAYLKYRPSKFDDSAIMHNFNALPPGNLSTNLNFDCLDDTTLGIFINLRNLKVLT